jgi:hypothetical protein
MKGLVTENVKFVVGLKPDADALAGTKSTDVVSLSKYSRALFALDRGTGSTGTQTITVEACDNFTPSNTVAIPFKSRRIASGDTMGDVVEQVAAGFTTVAGGDDTYLIEVSQADLPAGYPNVRMKSVEVVDAAVDAGISILLTDPRYAGDDLPTAIA